MRNLYSLIYGRVNDSRYFVFRHFVAQSSGLIHTQKEMENIRSLKTALDPKMLHKFKNSNPKPYYGHKKPIRHSERSESAMPTLPAHFPSGYFPNRTRNSSDQNPIGKSNGIPLENVPKFRVHNLTP